MKAIAAVFALAGAALTLSCSSHDPSMPRTYPVTGSVVTEAGKPYAGGSVQFRLDQNEDLTVMGEIAADGTFRLRTLKGSKLPADGAPAGSYEVTIYPPLGPDRKALFSTFTLVQKYTVEAKDDNHIEIRADPVPR